ncbi:ARM repeat-containing protein [Gymnopus androsaceus JB14]|uniref:ARM repeat-containing protein n=1 Tax=Gymnopus androsaceus JB14 TaxID=1447944 RepID=A0A6A4ILI2_9AGAR|nr:ARM repeat-containing protein [Gymnopus androsaceus JB14]
MDEDDISFADTPAEDVNDPYSLEMQKRSLQTYLDSVPYETETAEYMQSRLEEILGKIAVSAKAQNWHGLTVWDKMLQCWMLLQYPIPKVTRGKMVQLYYSLVTLPGIEARVVRSWADMLSRLLATKAGKRKLESTDLQLPWQPLWRALQKELWTKKRIQDSSRNFINILLFTADQCKRYYPGDEIQNMLATFLPMLTQETVLTIVPVITSFLPPTHCDQYLPLVFKLWEAFNSAVLDDRFLELAGELSEEHVAGATGDNLEGKAVWKDVGIWTETQWEILMGKGLGSMNVPVGITRGSSTTANHADAIAGNSQSLRIKKTVNRPTALAKILVYSMSTDGPVKADPSQSSDSNRSHPTGYLAGSKALDTLDRLITSTESFFHPSNSGQWSLTLTTFLQRLAAEFANRLQEEQRETCKTPVTRRLTSAIRKGFVKTLSTPALLAMFSKDPLSMGLAQASLRILSILEPSLMMPELLDRSYNGLEAIHETHRTTAALSMLSGLARPLTTESVWVGGQKHILPLLELCIPGIDLNDPIKTIYATMFIVSTVQHIKLGDLSIHQSGAPLVDDVGPMDTDDDATRLPAGTEAGMPSLSKSEERALVRDSTAGFADWVVALVRRVLALYENLPEEGGKRNVTGGKSEEGVLKSIKNMMDVVCLHLSDQLFDLVLNLVFDYGTTNAKSNAVRAFGQLVACLSRVKPEKTLAKFMPYCLMQIEQELKHGASSTRTTSTHSVIPSDTSLHWSMAILRGCLGYGGPDLLKHKESIITLVKLLVDNTKNERGYSGTGQLITRLLHTLAEVYPYNGRFVNTSEWNDPEFNRDHNLHWGKFYKPKDVEVDWHVPSDPEIEFVLQIIDEVAMPTLAKIEQLLERVSTWNSADRNDFCRFVQASKAIWAGLPTFLKEPKKDVPNQHLYESETLDLLFTHLDVQAGFTLSDPADPRYQKAVFCRTKFGEVILAAARAFRQKKEGEDHIDAVISVSKAMDVYLLDYGISKGHYDSLQKSYATARDLNRLWPKQPENSRLVYVKRAQLYHSGRAYMHSLYRSRSALDDALIGELVEGSLSPYTRVRRHAQGILLNVYGIYVRSARSTLSVLLGALTKGNDPDRMKGALYVLGDKGIMSYALADEGFHTKYLVSLLECQHEEKPSIQKLVNNFALECLSQLHEDVLHTDAYSLQTTPAVDDALVSLQQEFSPTFISKSLLDDALSKTPIRVAKRNAMYEQTITSILEIASRPNTHWRYVQMASKILSGLIRRDIPLSPSVLEFFLGHSLSSQPSIRRNSQKAITKILAHMKYRTYSKSSDELWREEWSNPLQVMVELPDPSAFLVSCQSPRTPTTVYIDKIRTGFLSWTPRIKGYRQAPSESPIDWGVDSTPFLQVIKTTITTSDYFHKLALLWGQEPSKTGSTVELRSENVLYIKSLAKTFEGDGLDKLLEVIDPLLSDSDKFKQRAGGEFLTGLLRGSKNWGQGNADKLWQWTMSRLDRIFAQIKPDTINFWESMFTYMLEERDPRRNTPLIDWILGLQLEFNGDSAFDMTKSLTVVSILIENMGILFKPMSDKYINLLFNNVNTSYAEIRGHISHLLYTLIKIQWQPFYPSTDLLLQACQIDSDPLCIRDARYQGRISEVLAKLPKWREERLPPPRVSLSEYDKVGLTLLQWIWVSAYGSQACLVFPYAITMMPEILRMSELNDSSELQTYSTAVLYVLSAVTPVKEYIPVILENFVTAIKSSDSWRIRHHALPALIVFLYRNLLYIPPDGVAKVMDVLLDCLADENVEVREMASKVLSGVVRVSQRQSILPLKKRFVSLIKKTKLPSRQDPTYASSLRTLHSAILGCCSLLESMPYSVEPWMPGLTDILAPHATDPPPISTTIRKTASEFKKTHQDTWHKDQLAFDEDQLQNLSTMLVGTSYYA